jgi:DNA modification methylase
MPDGPDPKKQSSARGVVRRRSVVRSAQGAAGLELVWEGKADALDRERVDPPGAPPPVFRLIERPTFRVAANPDVAWRHRLFHGDNLEVMRFIRAEFAEAVDLIYIDPPFDIGLDFGLRVRVGPGAEVETPAYSDRWSSGAGSHAHMMWERLRVMRALLKPSGCIFLHCDWRSSAVMRLLLDEIFGAACFRNEIVWRRAPNLGRQAASSQLGRVAESILVYSARPGTPFLGTTPFKSLAVPLDARGRPRGTQWDDRRQCYFTTAPRGDYTDLSVARLRSDGRIHDTPSGKVYVKYFLRKGEDGRWYKDQPVDTIWDDPDVRPLRHCGREELAVGYATQKPEGLLRRIISWASPPGGLVADFFCGSGTTGVAAQRLGRRWIMADASPVAIRVARGRLIGEARERDAAGRVPEAFEVLRLDDRHASRAASTVGCDVGQRRRRTLEWFGAAEGSLADPLLHGVAGDEAVHVLPGPASLDVAGVEAAARAAARSGFRRLCCLAERFDAALHAFEVAAGDGAGVQVRLVPIPGDGPDARGDGCRSWPGLPRIAIEAGRGGAGRIRVELLRCEWEGPGAIGGRDPLGAVDWWGVARVGDESEPFTPEWQDQRTWRRPRVESVGFIPDACGPWSIRVGVMDILGRMWFVESAIDRASESSPDLSERRG